MCTRASSKDGRVVQEISGASGPNQLNRYCCSDQWTVIPWTLHDSGFGTPRLHDLVAFPPHPSSFLRHLLRDPNCNHYAQKELYHCAGGLRVDERLSPPEVAHLHRAPGSSGRGDRQLHGSVGASNPQIGWANGANGFWRPFYNDCVSVFGGLAGGGM